MKTLERQLADYGDRQRELHGPISPDELVARRLLVAPVDTAVDSAGVEADVPRGDDLTVDYLQQRPDGSDAASEQKRWRGVVVAVAATILVVVGVVVVADGNSGDVVTDPASEPSATDPVATPTVTVPDSGPSPILVDALGYRWSRVPHDDAVFGGAGRQSMYDVTVGGPGLVAVGQSDSDAAVWTSVDGITWSRVPSDKAIFGGGWMSSVTVGGPGLVAVGGEGDLGDSDAVVWTSVDGLIWSRVPHDEAVFGGGWITGVIVAGPGLVAVGSVDFYNDLDAGTGGDAAVWTSVDGLIWSRVPHDEAVFGGADTQLMFDVIVGGPGLVAVGSDGLGVWDHNAGLVAAVWTSVDGITWSRVPHDEAVFGRLDYESDERDSQGMISVTAGGPGLVAVGSSWDPGWSALVWTSVDGITWSRAPDNEEILGDVGVMTGVTAGGPGLVAVGGGVWTSADGITWSRVPDNTVIVRWSDVNSVTVGGPGLVAVGAAPSPDLSGSDAAVWTAVDGIAWSRVPDDEATSDAG